MCGVPVHSAAPHIRKLAALGHRVAICEQTEPAKTGGGRRLVARDVVEVVTPGLVGDSEGLDADRELALVAIDPGDSVGLAVLDASTGDFRCTVGEASPVANAGRLPAIVVEELLRLDPREILIPVSAEPTLTPIAGSTLRSYANRDREPSSLRAPSHTTTACGSHRAVPKRNSA